MKTQYEIISKIKTVKNSGISTYLHRAWASVSNEDKPHGTTADTCYTAASSDTSYKENETG